MRLRWPFNKAVGTCEVHGANGNSVNLTLMLMIAASMFLIIWRVWNYGPSDQVSVGATNFPSLLWEELLDLFFSRHGMLAELWDILPYFIVGVLLGGYLRTYKVAVKLQATLRRYGILSVFLASLIGIITPLCACGTLTTALSLLFAGLPLAPVMAILVTSPLLSPSAFLLTLNDLGPEWTVVRTVSAYAMGVFAGLVVHLLRNKGFKTQEIFIEGGIIRGDFHDDDYPDERLRCNCRQTFGNRVAVRTDNKFIIFLAKSGEMCWPVGKYILVGVLVGTVVERYLPYQWIYKLFGGKDPLSIVWVTLGSVPLFLHQISASSILYHIKSSLDGTLNAGAALAFIIGGPVTAIPTLALFWTVFKKRVFFLYLSICIVGTLIIAYGANLLIFVPGVDTGNPLFKGVTSLSGGPSAIISRQNTKVRVVLDTDDRKTIAVVDSDPVSGQGGLVFDAGTDRLNQIWRLDNLTYFVNIAEWLEQESSGGQTRTTLIYNTRNDNSTVGREKYDQLASALRQQGFIPQITDRRQTPHLSDNLLAGFNQIWIIFGEGGDGTQLGDPELKAVTEFTSTGKGMLVVAGPGEGVQHDMKVVNLLTSNYGVTFFGYGDNRKEIKVSTGAEFLNQASIILEKVLKVFNKA